MKRLEFSGCRVKPRRPPSAATLAGPVELTPQILKRRSRRCEGRRIAQEPNSIREGKYFHDVQGGFLDPVLSRTAREEEMQCVKGARGV